MRKGAFYSLLGVLAVIAIGGTYLYAQRPERAVSNAVRKLAQAQTEHFHAVIALDGNPAIQSLLAEATSLNITLDGSFDRHGEDRAAQKGEPRPSDGRDSLVSDITINAKSDSVTLEIGGELRLIGDKAYLLVKKAPAAVPLLAALKDKWVELPRGSAPENKSAPENAPLFHEVKSVGREDVNGQTTKKYAVTATEQGIILFMDNIAGVLGTQLSDQQIGNLRTSLEKTDALPVELWVTPWSQEMVQLQASIPGNPATYTITFSDRNRPVSHTVPEGVRPIQEVLKQGQ